MKSDSKTDRLNDNNLIIVRRSPGYLCFLWYCVLLIGGMIMTGKQLLPAHPVGGAISAMQIKDKKG